MVSRMRRSLMAHSCAAMVVLGLSCHVRAQSHGAQTSANAQVARSVGTIKSMQSDSLTLTPDSGGEEKDKLSSSTKILRVPPGEKDLHNATPIPAQVLPPGDSQPVRAQAAADGTSITPIS